MDLKTTERIAVLETKLDEIKVSVDQLNTKLDKFCELNANDHSRYVTKEEFVHALNDTNKRMKFAKVNTYIMGILTAGVGSLLIWLLQERLR